MRNKGPQECKTATRVSFPIVDYRGTTGLTHYPFVRLAAIGEESTAGGEGGRQTGTLVLTTKRLSAQRHCFSRKQPTDPKREKTCTSEGKLPTIDRSQQQMGGIKIRKCSTWQMARMWGRDPRRAGPGGIGSAIRKGSPELERTSNGLQVRSSDRVGDVAGVTKPGTVPSRTLEKKSWELEEICKPTGGLTVQGKAVPPIRKKRSSEMKPVQRGSARNL